MNDQPVILVTGANGQLGNEIRSISADYPGYTFLFTDKALLPIDDQQAVERYFIQHDISYCINCAAYTAVDKAESEKDKAFLINGTAVGHLAAVCQLHSTQLIHISTDYVFDGTSHEPIKESAFTKPVNSYGESKLLGEQLALQHNPSTVIIRSSWIYSSFGNNFVKTIIRLMQEREDINLINDQTGCPTYAGDLANAIMQIIVGLDTAHVQFPAVFNYCNAGTATWYEFALAIKTNMESNCRINPISTDQYPTAAKRPQYSVLDTAKIKETFHIDIPDWKDSLQECLKKLK